MEPLSLPLRHVSRRRTAALRRQLISLVTTDVQHALAYREAEIDAVGGEGAMRALEREVILDVIDRSWRSHLYEMDYLKEGIGLRAMAQCDPVVEYKREGFDLFVGMVAALKEDVVSSLFGAPSPADSAIRGRRLGRAGVLRGGGGG